MMTCHLQRCNIMMAHQTVNNDGLIDQWPNWQLIILTSQNVPRPIGQKDPSQKDYVEIDSSKLTLWSNWTRGKKTQMGVFLTDFSNKKNMIFCSDGEFPKL